MSCSRYRALFIPAMAEMLCALRNQGLWLLSLGTEHRQGLGQHSER